ncbi:hypothetical protein OLMES_4496 [Oleiphilus messinensis]|uniref:Lipoprotein n=2 Tax=Oleiphilus messinensis TaxID=141451 RepID=A0A1Y0ID58_9GAMM|nr:hypothetical protein OLMES_4496 [Oleiphilus messinensis]
MGKKYWFLVALISLCGCNDSGSGQNAVTTENASEPEIKSLQAQRMSTNNSLLRPPSDGLLPSNLRPPGA